MHKKANPIPHHQAPLYPEGFKLTEEKHATLAQELPKIAGTLKNHCFAIFAAYHNKPRGHQEHELSNYALFTVEILDQLLANLEDVARSQYPNSDWLTGYSTAHPPAKRPNNHPAGEHAE